MAQALPHRRRLRLADPAAIVDGILRVGHLLDPIGKPSQELPIIVGEAGREIKRALGPDRTHRAGGYAELAFKAGIVFDWVVVIGRLAVDQYSPQQDEVSIFWVNQIAMNPHMAKPCLDRNRFV